VEVWGRRGGFPEAATGVPADVFIRPETLRFACPGEAAIARGVVSAQVFQGGHMHIFIDTPSAPSGRVLMRQTAANEEASLAPGSPVSLAMAGSQNISIFPPEPPETSTP